MDASRGPILYSQACVAEIGGAEPHCERRARAVRAPVVECAASRRRDRRWPARRDAARQRRSLARTAYLRPEDRERAVSWAADAPVYSDFRYSPSSVFSPSVSPSLKNRS